MKQKASNWINVLVILLLSVFPLIYDDLYFNITVTKYKTFAILALTTFFLGILYTLCIHFNTYKGLQLRSIKDYCKELSLSDIMFLGFLLAGFISFLGSEWKLPAFSGGCGKYIGLLFMLLAGGMYYGVSRHFCLNRTIKYTFPIILILLSVMAVLQFCGYDVLSFYEHMKAGTSVMYIATFGHIDVFSAFLSVYVPICFYMLCMTKDKKETYLYGIASFFGFISIFCANSDSSYIGCGIALIILFIIVLNNQTSILRYQLLIVIYILSVLSWNILHYIYKETIREQSDLTALVTASSGYLIGISLLLILTVVSLLIRKKNISPKKFQFLFGFLFLAVFIGIVILFFYFSIIDKTSDLGFLTNYFRFNKYWGSERGYVWIWLTSYFISAPFFIKLFGAGPDTTTLILYQNFKKEMSDELGVYYASAHNEYLNYLVTIGLVGTIFYIALLITSVWNCYKNLQKDSFYGAILLAIISYSAMAIVNISQPITVPFIFLLIAMANPKNPA